MGKPIAKNPDVTNLFGVCDVLHAIDLEKIQPMNLKAKVVIYMARLVCNQSFTAIFYGPLEAKCLEKRGVWRKYGDYRLPQAEYIRHEANENQETIENIPFEMLWSNAAYLQFILRAETPEEFEDFLAVPYFIRDMVDKGWNQYNPHHTSKFWFHLSKDNLNKQDSVMLGVSGDGLVIYKTEVDGIPVFTTADMERFMELGKKKEG
ncbi:MAG: hypothetical protein KAT43_02150 [Nanoarchaeota archaeon]|nr:hypothetical protein [Nanoarchaeota archaeon]